ncbi:SDR family oxidoreductase [Ornithinimicrobium humiphilum]|uniref:Short-subunit dehydrogenase n=1 Tax=Ornithinimicrobium humiphilum TaxID=125288 RepID=A0A543KJP9_9MICO|nr:SDR family oxidoreductase [Ornithinimicrobium humiphilum]TQM95298.1 short-subunit dehydrogenase [Ornithinimicrobium humiphilum]
MDFSARPVALVAGGSRGLGLLVATELAELGHDVAIFARDLEETTEGARLAEERAREASGVRAGRVRPYRGDVTDRDSVDAVVADVERDLGPIEVLVHVAGIIQVGPAETMTLEHFDRAVGVMLMGPVNTAWAVLPGMRERGHGRIGVVTSIGGKVPSPHLLPYVTAKFGAVGFTEALAAELAGTGVTATTLVPGLMRTGSPEQALFTGDREAEYAWFAPGASIPLVSMDARRAARKMVRATLAGRPVLQLSPMTLVGTRVHGLMPATTVRLVGVMNRLLPSAPGTPDQSEARPGREAAAGLDTGVVGALTVLGRRAARRLNQRSSQGSSTTVGPASSSS